MQVISLQIYKTHLESRCDINENEVTPFFLWMLLLVWFLVTFVDDTFILTYLYVSFWLLLKCVFPSNLLHLLFLSNFINGSGGQNMRIM